MNNTPTPIEDSDEFPVMTFPSGDNPLVVRAEVARQLKRELNEARSLLQSCLSAMPCNSTPRHTVESLPDRIEDLAKELASETREREQLERELAAANERIRRLEEAGDAIVDNGSVSERLLNSWNEAKGDSHE